MTYTGGDPMTAWAHRRAAEDARRRAHPWPDVEYLEPTRCDHAGIRILTRGVVCGDCGRAWWQAEARATRRPSKRRGRVPVPWSGVEGVTRLPARDRQAEDVFERARGTMHGFEDKTSGGAGGGWPRGFPAYSADDVLTPEDLQRIWAEFQRGRRS